MCKFKLHWRIYRLTFNIFIHFSLPIVRLSSCRHFKIVFICEEEKTAPNDLCKCVHDGTMYTVRIKEFGSSLSPCHLILYIRFILYKKLGRFRQSFVNASYLTAIWYNEWTGKENLKIIQCPIKCVDNNAHHISIINPSLRIKERIQFNL